MKKINSIIAVFGFIVSAHTWAHGEEKPGPHGGVIRMPGAFHTEIKEKSAHAFEIFLLDMEWKNPQTHDSKIVAHWKTENIKIKLPCSAKKDRFVCKLPSGKKLKSGDHITLQATRAGQSGAEVSYKFPFKPGISEMKSEHHGH